MDRTTKRIILDTDIGDDIDDIWALALMLKSGRFDIPLISVCYADIEYKQKTVLKFYSDTGYPVPLLAAGREAGHSNTPHYDRVNAVSLPEKTLPAAEALEKSINGHDGKTDILAIGPLTNIADMLKRNKSLAAKIRLIIMGGSVYQGYINQTAPTAEFNFACDPSAAATVFGSGAEIVLVPLDVCRDYIICGDMYKQMAKSGAVVSRAVFDYYYEWQKNYFGGAIKHDPEYSSGILYDVVPVMYLLKPELFTEKTLRLKVNADGFTTESPDGNKMSVLTDLKKQDTINFAAKIFAEAD